MAHHLRNVVRVGSGPGVLLIHGSATDHATWSIQLATAGSGSLTLIAYDRDDSDGDASTIEKHAADAAAFIEAEHAPMVVVGSSFGGVVALELARNYPQLIRGAVLCEPPLASSDDEPPIPRSFMAEFDALVAEQGGPAAAAMFMRTVLGPEVFARMPAKFRDRCTAMWRAIRADCGALGRYPVRYSELGAVTTEVLLLGGDRSAAYFAPTLAALEQALPNVTRQTLVGAGHMMHAEAPRAFIKAVTEFALRV